jgi:hypothetical protein
MVHTRATAIVLMALLTGCAGTGVRSTTEGLGQVAQTQGEQSMPVLVVSQPFFSGDFQSWEIYQKTYDLCAQLNGAHVPVMAPWEYRVFNPQENPLLGSTVAQVLRDEGVSPDGSLQLELRVVMLGGTGDVVVHGTDTRSARTLQRGEVRLIVRSMYDSVELARIVAPFEEDNLAVDVTAANKTPALGRALKVATVELVAALQDHYCGAAGSLGAKLTFNPRHMFQYTVGDQRPLRDRFRKLDAMDSMARKLPYYQYFAPDISVDAVMRFEASDPGLLVEMPGELAAHGIERGDYIVAVGGHLAHGPQVLHRPFLTRASSRVTIEFVRDGRNNQIVVQN